MSHTPATCTHADTTTVQRSGGDLHIHQVTDGTCTLTVVAADDRSPAAQAARALAGRTPACHDAADPVAPADGPAAWAAHVTGTVLPRLLAEAGLDDVADELAGHVATDESAHALSRHGNLHEVGRIISSRIRHARTRRDSPAVEQPVAEGLYTWLLVGPINVTHPTVAHGPGRALYTLVGAVQDALQATHERWDDDGIAAGYRHLRTLGLADELGTPPTLAV